MLYVKSVLDKFIQKLHHWLNNQWWLMIRKSQWN